MAVDKTLGYLSAVSMLPVEQITDCENEPYRTIGTVNEYLG